MFDATGDSADRDAFAERCEGDRHHFGFIVSPEDAGDLSDLRTFTRELMGDMARDLKTELDWVAVDHWNTDNPHIHVLVRGRGADGADLVIDRGYIKEGLRSRAEERVTIELGPRNEVEIGRALAREVTAERWTSLDRGLVGIADAGGGIANLLPGGGLPEDRRALLAGRAAQLERLGLAKQVAPGCWSLKPGLEPTLRAVGERGDVIKTMHRALQDQGRGIDPSGFAIHGDGAADPVLGRLVERGLRDELAGSGYAIVEGIDGRTHHLTFRDLEATGDAAPGSIVELRRWEDGKGREWTSLAVRSDLPIERQVTAPGATWLDRRNLDPAAAANGNGFGREVGEAMTARADHLVAEGMARRQGQRVIFMRDLLDTLARRELADAAQALSDRHGLPHRPSATGGHVAGVYRERVDLSSGRFAMIDDGLGFQLVPWSRDLERKLGQHVAGVAKDGGGIEWAIGRKRDLGI